MCNFRISEKSLKLSFLGRITLLYLSAAAFEGLFGVRLGGACCAAAAVTSCASAEENDNIARLGNFSYNIFNGSSAYNSAYFQSLCNVAGVIYLGNMTCCKTYLVAVGAIAVSCAHGDLSLGELAVNGVLNGNERIGSTCYTHSLIYI